MVRIETGAGDELSLHRSDAIAGRTGSGIDAREVRIILVEDDEAHAALAKMVFERNGLKNGLTHFASGRKALDFLQEDARERGADSYLVILDLNMPDLDGRQILACIRNDARLKHVPVVVLSTVTAEKEIARCYFLGCDTYLNKPLAYEDFTSAIHELGMVLEPLDGGNLRLVR